MFSSLSVMAPPRLASSWKGFLRPFSIPLANPLWFTIFLRTQRSCLFARSWSATAVGPLAAAAPPWRLERRRGVAVSPRTLLGQVGLGPETRAGPSPLPSARLLRPKAAVGQSFSWAGPVVIGKMFSVFLFIIWEEKYFGKCLCTHFGSEFVETNFVRFLVTRST